MGTKIQEICREDVIKFTFIAAAATKQIAYMYSSGGYVILPPVIYSVTQSQSNSFWGDDVLDSFKMVYKDEESILDQTYEKQISSNFYYDYNIIQKCVITPEEH